MTPSETLPPWWPPLPIPGPTIPWNDDEDGRNTALSLGAEHRRIIDAYRALAKEHGGGLLGTLQGMLAEYVRRGLVSERDGERLIAIMEAFRLDDQAEAVQTILRLHDEAVRDPDAKPAALAVSSIAAEGVSQTLDDSLPHTLHELATHAADVGGAIIASPMGPLGMLATSIAASHVVESTHVTVTVTVD